MDKQTLIDAMRLGPIRVFLNDGRSYVIPNIEFCIIDDIAAHVLTKGEDGRSRARILSLVTMTEIEQLAGNTDLEVSPASGEQN